MHHRKTGKPRIVNRQSDLLVNSISRLLAVRSSLGMFDESCPFNRISPSQNVLPEHERLSVKAAEQGIVLLENNGILPLKAGKQRILVVGYNAENDLAYLGSYCGTPKAFCKVTEAVKLENPDSDYVQGYSYNLKENEQLQQQALEKGEEYDLILFCSGLDCSFEGEQAGELIQGGGEMLGEQGDRQTLGLPDVQLELFRKLCTLNKKMIVLNFSGGCVDLRDGKAHADAILQYWYPGALGGKAVSNLLFGAVSPWASSPSRSITMKRICPTSGITRWRTGRTAILRVRCSIRSGTD